MALSLTRYCLFIFLFAALAEYASAAEEARLLPAGINRIRVVGVGASTVTRKLNDDGFYTSLGGANQTVNMKIMAAGNPKLNELRKTVNSLLGNGAGDNLYTANLYQDISAQQQIMGTAYEYGLSERWNIGVRLRFVRQTVRSSLRVEAVNNAPALRSSIAATSAGNSELDAGLAQVAALDTNAWENIIFRDKGYDAPSEFTRSNLGYTEVGAKYKIVEGDWHYSSALFGVRVPTGKNPSLKNPLDAGSGANYWGAGLQLFQDFYLSKTLTLSAAAKYEYYPTHTRTLAVPKDANDTLPSLLPEAGQVQNVKRKVGGLIDAEVSTTYEFEGKFVSLWAAYQYRKKAEDRFSGPGDLFYSGLSRGTKLEAFFGETGISFSTISLYRKKKFAVPMVMSVLYNTTLSGFNTPDASYTRVDMKFYF
jgi:hypothetical protein